MNPTRVVFYGTSAFTQPILEALAQDTRLTVVGVVTQPDRPTGRHAVLTAPPIKQCAERLHLPLFQFEQLRSDEAYQVLSSLKADVAVIASFGQIIPQRVLDLYPRGALNWHPSRLPQYRGAIPLTAAIRDGLEETAVTIMLMDAQMDHGPILAQLPLPLLATDTTATLTTRAGADSAAFFVETLHAWLENKIQPREQDHTAATFVKLLSREDGKIDWSKPAADIERLIRAYTPWPGTYTEYRGKRLKILRAHVVIDEQQETGALIFPAGDDTFLVADEVQPEGKQPMSGADFLRGQR